MDVEHEVAASELRDRSGPSISCVEGPFLCPYLIGLISYCERPISNCARARRRAAQPGRKGPQSTNGRASCGFPVENLAQQGDNFRLTVDSLWTDKKF